MRAQVIGPLLRVLDACPTGLTARQIVQAINQSSPAIPVTLERVRPALSILTVRGVIKRDVHSYPYKWST